MMKKLVKIICVCLVVALALGLSACGTKEFKCDICQQTKKSKEHKVEGLLGNEITVCDDCYKAYEKAENIVDSLT